MQQLIIEEGISQYELDLIVTLSLQIKTDPITFIKNLRKSSQLSGLSVLEEFYRLKNSYNLR
ncbi:hypothetical protein CIK00_03090 [Photobacterium carnosum]|uniref:Uncharacterized protein n=1 Tax=Photobacterium carnosum TaxID=2023717 RepID=A0A2N4UW77_9GAMM|nr:hypothetical protein CIK00_03090 [Photobacterium carnosum]